MALARVVEVKKGQDVLVRSAKIKTNSTVVTRAKQKRRGDVKTTAVILERPITKLCHLELDE